MKGNNRPLHLHRDGADVSDRFDDSDGLPERRQLGGLGGRKRGRVGERE